MSDKTKVIKDVATDTTRLVNTETGEMTVVDNYTKEVLTDGLASVGNQLQYLFVYGTLKFGFNAHYILEGGGLEDRKPRHYKKIGNCSIPGAMIHMGNYPGLIRNTAGCRVTGEIYEVSWDTIARCDRYEGVHSGLYERCKVDTTLGSAWVYYFKNFRELLTPKTNMCGRGVWIGPGTERVTLNELTDYFANKRYNEPQNRTGPQPVLDAIPESSPAGNKGVIVRRDAIMNTERLPPPKKEPFVPLQIGPELGEL